MNGDRRIVNFKFELEQQLRNGERLYHSRSPLPPAPNPPLPPPRRREAAIPRGSEADNEEDDDQFLLGTQNGEEQQNQMERETDSLPLSDEERRYYDRLGNMHDSVFRRNVLRMTIMHSLIAFCGFLLHLQLKYLEGSIYTNSNYCAISAIIAILSGSLIYAFLGGIKPTYFLGFVVSTIGTLAILHRINDLADTHIHILRIE